MAERVVGIHPAVLKWAREAQGYSIEDVAAKLKRDAAEIASWEAGDSFPTYAQLEKLAYQIYKRPLAAFFLPVPPAEPDVKRQFRTLPAFDLDSLSANTRYQIRLAQALQLSLKELNEGVNPSPKKIFRDIRLVPTLDVRSAAVEVRRYIGVPLETQLAWDSDEEALKSWRLAVEDAGVFVFKNAFKQKEISGLCLLDAEFPIIYLNNSTTKTRQTFSLLHELGHVLLGVYGISKFDRSYIDHLGQQEQRIEIFCNTLAAEILIPSADFETQLRTLGRMTDAQIEDLARRYRVSREAIMRRLLDRGMVSQTLYREKAAQWAGQVKEPGPGGNYYATQATYLGERYLQLVLGKHYQGKLSLEQVADYLGVKTSSVAGLEELALRKTVAE